MQTPSAQALLDVWERGQGETSARRAMLLLATAFPDTPGNDLASLPLGRRNALLLAVRVHVFGSELDGTAPCPSCAESLEIRFPLPDLVDIDGPNQCKAVHALTAGPYHVRYRLPNTNDLLDLAGGDIDDGAWWLFVRCVVEARDGTADVASDALPADVVDRVGEAMAEADPFGAMELTTVCPGCGASCDVAFDPASYLWIEVDHWARRMVRDVHDLASVYGWSESDILTMSPWRRHAYLELLPA